MPLDVEATVQALAWMLLGASLVGMLARWIRLPYTVALVLAGVLVEETHVVAVPHLEPRVLLFVFLPPLLFDAAFRLNDRELRSVLRPVLVLALPGTVATALIAGLLLWGAYLLADEDRLAYATMADLGIAVVLGLTMAGRWIRVYRTYRRPAAKDRSATQVVTIPPERNFPVPAVILHGVLATTTVVLVVLTVFTG